MVHPTKIRPNEPNKNSWAKYDEWRQGDCSDGVNWFENSRYSVALVEMRQTLLPFPCWKVMIVNQDQSAHHDWRDFQRIKNDLFGEQFEAIELYPAEERKVDPSNAFILYVFKGHVPLGETIRSVIDPACDAPLAPQRSLARGEPL